MFIFFKARNFISCTYLSKCKIGYRIVPTSSAQHKHKANYGFGLGEQKMFQDGGGSGAKRSSGQYGQHQVVCPLIPWRPQFNEWQARTGGLPPQDVCELQRALLSSLKETLCGGGEGRAAAAVFDDGSVWA
uniref:Uncharacterized protein n=1 Tax=Micrurus lemniscatus lemniscatus TaxID=129467 RepID=A0A2D4IC36_MICLE